MSKKKSWLSRVLTIFTAQTSTVTLRSSLSHSDSWQTDNTLNKNSSHLNVLKYVHGCPFVYVAVYLAQGYSNTNSLGPDFKTKNLRSGPKFSAASKQEVTTVVKSSSAKIGSSSPGSFYHQQQQTNKQRHFLCSDCALIYCQRRISFLQLKRTCRRNFNTANDCTLRWVTVGTWQDQTDCFHCQLYISGLRKTYFLNRYHRATTTTSTTQHIITTACRIVCC